MPALVFFVAFTAACTVPVDTVQPAASSTGDVSTTQLPADILPSTVLANPAQVHWEDRLRTDLDEVMASSISGRIGVAVAPVGSDSATTFGAWTDGSAWSTIKVPLVLASMAHDATYQDYAASAAITQSDNASAEQVWRSLGDDTEAAGEVESILAAGGDSVTEVPDTQLRLSYSIFGQTQWSLIQQTVFAAHLPCLPDGVRILDMMGDISPSQSWGLGTLEAVEFKGGWGPDAGTGGYLVRQFGLLHGGNGITAVSIAAEPDSGSFDDGIAMLDVIAGVLAAHRIELPSAVCADAPVSDITTEQTGTP